jgi:hypothetical protein
MNDEAQIREQINEEKRRKNREEFPDLAKLMDEVNAKYPGSKLIWAKDLATGKEIGKKSVVNSAFEITKDTFPQPRTLPNVRKGRGKTR